VSRRRPIAVVVVVVVAALALALVACAAPAPALVRQRPRQPLVFVDVNVVDGTGGPARPHQDVVVDGDRIVAVRPTGDASSALPRDRVVDGRVVDGRGRTLLPGFVDAHVHALSSGGLPLGPGLSPAESLQRWLAVGVTSIYDMGTAAADLDPWVTDIDAGVVPGPRIYHTNLLITGRGSHPIALGDALLPGVGALLGFALPQVQTEADIAPALDVVEEAVPDYVKIVVDRMPAGEPIMDRAVLVALVKAARARGHRVFVHAGEVDDAVAAAEAGCTALAHLPWRGALTADKARRLKDAGVVVVTTVWMWERTAALLAGRFVPTPAEEQLVPRPLLEAAEQRPDHPRLAALAQELDDNAPARAAALQALLAAGVPLVVGTDSALPGVWPGSAFIAERQALLAAGLPVADLIPAMTSRAARLVGGANVDFGVVQPGKVADLVLVDGDPLQDPMALDRIALVVHRGRVVEPLAPPTGP
jgi:imidazolonepropionase-like amidohydrolase